MLAELVARHARRSELNGSLIALLASERPSALVGLAGRLRPAPFSFVQSGSVLAAMENDAELRGQLADAVFWALAAQWRTFDDVDRFLAMMERDDSQWICARLGRLTGEDGILKARETRLTNISIESMPRFLPLVLRRTARRCPDATLETVTTLLSTSGAERREAIMKFARNELPDLAARLLLPL